jgi:hypothetical protein
MLQAPSCWHCDATEKMSHSSLALFGAALQGLKIFRFRKNDHEEA